MKNIILGLLVLSSFSTLSNTFAGELVNRKTGESIQLSKENGVLIVDGTNAGMSIQNINLENVNSNYENRKNAIEESLPSPLGLTVKLTDHLEDNQTSGAFILMYPLTFATDMALLPIKASIIAGKLAQTNKDIQLIKKVIIADESVEMSSMRFNRIKKYFWH